MNLDLQEAPASHKPLKYGSDDVRGETALKIEKISQTSMKRLEMIISELLVCYDMVFDGIMQKNFGLSSQAIDRINKILDYSINIHQKDISEKNKINYLAFTKHFHWVYKDSATIPCLR